MEGCKSSCYCSAQVYLPWVHSKMLLSTKLSIDRVGWHSLLRTSAPSAKGHWAKCWSNLVLVLYNNLLVLFLVAIGIVNHGYHLHDHQ